MFVKLNRLSENRAKTDDKVDVNVNTSYYISNLHDRSSKPN